MFVEHECVALKNAVSGIPLLPGSKGTILIVHPVDPPVYLVEFPPVSDDDDGLYDIRESDLVSVAKA
jgi:hypothetical protein